MLVEGLFPYLLLCSPCRRLCPDARSTHSRSPSDDGAAQRPHKPHSSSHERHYLRIHSCRMPFFPATHRHLSEKREMPC